MWMWPASYYPHMKAAKPGRGQNPSTCLAHRLCLPLFSLKYTFLPSPLLLFPFHFWAPLPRPLMPLFPPHQTVSIPPPCSLLCEWVESLQVPWLVGPACDQWLEKLTVTWPDLSPSPPAIPIPSIFITSPKVLDWTTFFFFFSLHIYL